MIFSHAPLLRSKAYEPFVAPPSLSLSFVTSALSGTQNITIPASAAEGDIAILFDMALNFAGGGAPAEVVPAGFTKPTGGSFTLLGSTYAIRETISYKVLGASDPGSSVTGQLGGVYNSKIMLVFRPSDTLTGTTLADLATEGTESDPAQQTVNASGGTAPLLVLASYASEGAGGTDTFSPAADAQVVDGSDILRVSYRIDNTSPSDTDVDMGDEGHNMLASFYFEASNL